MGRTRSFWAAEEYTFGRLWEYHLRVNAEVCTMARFILVALQCAIRARFRFEEIWESSWFGKVVALPLLALLIYFQFRLPAPGVAVAFMGVIASLMAARSKAHGWEKSFWMLMITALLITEVLSIGEDRHKHDDAFANLLNKLTGGNSYAVVIPAQEMNNPTIPLEVRISKQSGDNPLEARIFVRQVPKSEEQMRLFDNPKWETLEMKTPWFWGSIDPYQAYQLSKGINPPDDGTTMYVIYVFAQNGQTKELLQIRRNEKTTLWEYLYEIRRGPRIMEAISKWTLLEWSTLR
jgi:hypothetical protein